MQSKEGRTKLLLGLWVAMVLNVETTAPPL